jgi:predicted nucleotidyltransferase
MSKNVRLTQFEIDAIISSFHEFFNPDDTIWLFGSRADMSKRGGDIDLYIQTSIKDYMEAYYKKHDFSIKLQDIIGEQKIDIVLDLGTQELPIYEVAKTTGVKL